MGLLDGGLQADIFAGFKGKLLTGVLRRHAVGDSTALDDLGDPLDTAAEPDIPIQGFVDQFSAFVRAQPGFPQTDVKTCIFGASMLGVRPKAHDMVRWDFTDSRPSQWYRLREGDGAIRTDPAEALWECQSYEIEAPE